MTAFNLEALLLLFIAFVLGLAAGLFLRRARRDDRPAAARADKPAASAPPVPLPPAAPAMPQPAAGPVGSGAPGMPVAPFVGTAGPAIGIAAREPAETLPRPAPAAGAPSADDALPDLFSRLATGAGALPLATPDAASDAAAARAEAEPHPGVRPPMLSAPEGGVADDLKLLKGIGPQNEQRLNALGIFHFRQIAAWTADEAAWVGSSLAFPGRIEREDWVGQAKALLSGTAPEDLHLPRRKPRGPQR